MRISNKTIIGILQNGPVEGCQMLKENCTSKQIRKAATTYHGFEAKTRNFISLYFNISIEDVKPNGLIRRAWFNYDAGKTEVYYESV